MLPLMFFGRLFLCPSYYYTYPHTTQLSLHEYIYDEIIGFFEQSIKKLPQNPQIPTYVVKVTQLVN